MEAIQFVNTMSNKNKKDSLHYNINYFNTAYDNIIILYFVVCHL